MKKIFSFSLLILFISFSSFAQDLSLFAKKEFIKNGDTLRYRILLPENFEPTKHYPMVLFLHGAGERGNDNEKQLVHGGKMFLEDSIRTKYPAIVVFPQCPQNSYWSSVNIKFDSSQNKRVFKFNNSAQPSKAMTMVMDLYQQLRETLLPDSERLYVGGLSMGGMGTFELAYRMPQTFAAAFAICGGADTNIAPGIANTAWSVYHGMRDNVVDPQFSLDMAEALKVAGAEVRLTTYPEANHNSWDSAFAEPDFLSWLFNHKKKEQK